MTFKMALSCSSRDFASAGDPHPRDAIETSRGEGKFRLD
jgi:hypothetical protein